MTVKLQHVVVISVTVLALAFDIQIWKLMIQPSSAFVR